MIITLKSKKELEIRSLNRLEVADINDEVRAYWIKYPEARESLIVPEKAMLKAILLATDMKISDLNSLTDAEIFEAGNQILEKSKLTDTDKKK